MAEIRQAFWLKLEDVPPLPKGWRALSTEEASIQLKPGKLFDSKTVSQKGEVPVLNQSEGGFLGYHDEEPGVMATPDAPVVTFANHTCAMRLMKQPFSTIQNIFPKIGKPGLTDTVYFYYASLGRVGLSDYKGHHPVFRKAHIPVPPLPVQRQIAGILSAYDDLIENCQRRIKILEEMARLLYREWFVHFRYPGHESVPLVDSRLGPIPQGWEVKGIKDIAQVTYGFAFKSKHFNTERIGTPIVRIRDIPKGTAETYTDEEAPDKFHIRDGHILVGMDGDFHMCVWSAGPALQVQRVARFEPTGAVGNHLLFLVLEKPIHVLNKSIVGTTVAHLGDSHIKEIMVAIPSSSLLPCINATFDPILEQIIVLKKSTANLRRTRDLLLPHLLGSV